MPIVHFRIVDLLALVAADLVSTDLVEHVRRAVPAECFFDVLAAALGSDGYRAVGALDDDWIDILLLLVVIVEISSLLVVVLLRVELVLEHAI